MSPLWFGWRQGQLRQNIVAICDCDFFGALKGGCFDRGLFSGGGYGSDPPSTSPPRTTVRQLHHVELLVRRLAVLVWLVLMFCAFCAELCMGSYMPTRTG